MEPSGLLHAVLFVVFGLAVLAGGGEILVRGAINASRLLRIAPAVIGLTIVALATSLPELAVSLLAAFRGSPDLAVGNIVGSNMFNIAVIIGLTAILFPPLAFRSAKIRFDVAVMIVASAALIVTGWNGFLGRAEGAVLLAGLAVFLWIRVRDARGEGVDEEDARRAIQQHGSKSRGVLVSLLLIFGGTALLTAGAELLVRGAVVIAREAGVSERVIAITLVSAGTGLPELATAIVAGIRRQSSVAIGNVIGSNIFNALGILGAVALIHPIPASTRITHQDGFWMLGLALALLLPVGKTGRLLSRWEGAVFLVLYTVYVVRLFRA